MSTKPGVTSRPSASIVRSAEPLDRPHLGDHTAGDRHVGAPSGCTRSVDDPAAADDEIVLSHADHDTGGCGRAKLSREDGTMKQPEGQYEPSPWDWVRDQVDDLRTHRGSRGEHLSRHRSPDHHRDHAWQQDGQNRGRRRSCASSTTASTRSLRRSVAHPSTRSGTSTCSPIPTPCNSRTAPNRSR